METRTRTTGTTGSRQQKGKVAVSVPPPLLPEEWTNPLDNPERAKSELASLASELSSIELPVVPVPPDDIVNLPGGYVGLDGTVIRTGRVKELNGDDEESLARAAQSSNPFHFIDRLLQCGVAAVGNLSPAETAAALRKLLIGDREAFILGIRRATYGEEITVADWTCPICISKSDLTMEVSDIPVTRLDDPMKEIFFEVPMRKGGHAEVHLANGDDQLAIFEKDGLTQAQRETVLLSKCVENIIDASGHRVSVAAFPSVVRTMSVTDRHAILDELAKRQPGPKYDQIEYTCENCGEGVKVAVGLGDLFLHFR